MYVFNCSKFVVISKMNCHYKLNLIRIFVFISN